MRRKLGFDPDPKQALVLTSASKRGMLNCARQWGKSTITAAKAVHEAVRRKESRRFQDLPRRMQLPQ